MNLKVENLSPEPQQKRSPKKNADLKELDLGELQIVLGGQIAPSYTDYQCVIDTVV